MGFISSFIFVFFTLAIASAQADSSLPGCESVRLDGPGGPYEKIPVPDQKNVGICYAHASAQFLQGALNQYYHTQDTPELSALEAALENRIADQKTKKTTAVYGGYQAEVTQRLLDRGYACREDHRWNVTAQTDTDERAFRNSLLKLPYSWLEQKNIERKLLKQTGNLTKADREYITDPENGLTTLIIGSNRETLIFFPSTCTQNTSSSILNIGRTIFASQNVLIANYYDQPYFEAARKMAFKPCSEPGNQIKLPPPNEWKLQTGAFTSSSTTLIHQALDQGYPAGVGLCLQVYTEGRQFKNCSERVGHDALVVGRRTQVVNGKPTCQLLLRNWYGRECLDYSSDWACDQAHGSVWVDQDVLVAGAKELTTLELPDRHGRKK